MNLAVLAFVVGASTFVVARLTPSIIPNLATGASVTASSRDPNSPEASKVIDGDIYRLGFSTVTEQNPWVLLDFGAERLVQRIVLYNRIECCQERGIPLSIQLGRSRDDLREVAKIEKGFERLGVAITPRTARFLRIRSTRSDSLSLNEIEVR